MNVVGTSLNDYFERITDPSLSSQRTLALAHDIASSGTISALADSALDMFLTIPGIVGESKDEAHRDAIEIGSFSWGAFNDGSGAVAQDFVFAALPSRASVELFRAVADGHPISQAVLSLRKSGEERVDFLSWTLSDIQITSYQTASGGDRLDTFSIGFGAVGISYRLQSSDGTFEPPLTAEWDLEQRSVLAAATPEPSEEGAAVKMFLTIPDIVGESKDEAHRDAIEIGSFSWGAFNDGSGAVAQDFVFAALPSRASVELFRAVADGHPISQAVLSLRKSGEERVDFLSWTLSDIQITSYQTASGGDRLDTFSIGFGAVGISYRLQSSDGTFEPPLTAEWDLEQRSVLAAATPEPSEEGAAVKMFLTIPDIVGESKDEAHRDAIEIGSFSWGAFNDGSGAVAQDFVFAALPSRASVELFRAVADGHPISQAVLSLRKSGEERVDFLSWTLSDIQITSYQTASGGDRLDTFSIGFGAVGISYRLQSPDGTFEPPLTAEWDLEQRSVLAAATPEPSEEGAAVKMFLTIPDIVGESKDEAHRDAIEIGSFSWGAFNDGSGAVAQDFVFAALPSRASVELFRAVADGHPISQAVLSLRKSGEERVDFLSWTLSDIQITSYQTASGGDRLDTFSIGFGAVGISYRLQSPDGTFEPPLTAEWDLEQRSVLAAATPEPSEEGAAVKMFLTIPDIVGESKDEAHRDAIEIGSFSWGAFNDGSGAVAQDFVFAALPSRASVELFRAVADGHPISQAVLSLRKSGEERVDFLSWTLSDIQITSYQTASGGDRLDTFSIGFGAVGISYRLQSPDGTFEPPLTAEWDLEQRSVLAAATPEPSEEGAAVKMFLTIPDIVGESKDEAHRDAIEIGSFSWGAFNDGSGAVAQDFVFAALPSRASVELFRAVADGHPISQAVLSLRKSGEERVDFLSWTLSDIQITSYQTASGGDRLDTFSIGFGAVGISYRLQSPDGTFEPPLTAEWDLRNHGPVAVDDESTTTEDKPVVIEVLANDSDSDLDPLTVSVLGVPSNGLATVNGDGTITYVPDVDFHGVDSFSYSLDDGRGGAAQAVVTVNVLSAPQQLDNVLDFIENLTDDGELNNGQAGALLAMIARIDRSLERNNIEAAVNQAKAFIHHVQGLINGGILSPADGRSLIEATEDLLRTLQDGDTGADAQLSKDAVDSLFEAIERNEEDVLLRRSEFGLSKVGANPGRG